MTPDILERLQFRSDANSRDAYVETKRLRIALDRIAVPDREICYCRDGREEAVLLARAALTPKDPNP